MAITGKSGRVIMGGSTLCVTGWTVNHDIGRTDITSTCSLGNKELIIGISTWTGTFESLDYSGSGGSATVSFYNPDVTISGSALINLSINSPVQDKVTFTYDVAWSGIVTAS